MENIINLIFLVVSIVIFLGILVKIFQKEKILFFISGILKAKKCVCRG